MSLLLKSICSQHSHVCNRKTGDTQGSGVQSKASTFVSEVLTAMPSAIVLTQSVPSVSNEFFKCNVMLVSDALLLSS